MSNSYGNKLQLIVISNIVNIDKRIETKVADCIKEEGDNKYWGAFKIRFLQIQKFVKEYAWAHEIVLNHTKNEVYEISGKTLEQKARIFAKKGKVNTDWALGSILKFI